MTEAQRHRRPDGARELSALVCERVRLAAALACDQHGGEATAVAARLSTVEREIGAGSSALQRLAELFRLSAPECDLLSTCVALALDPTLGPLFARVEQAAGRSHVTDPLVARLFGHPPGRVWNPAGSLALWNLVFASPVGPGEPDALCIDPVVPAWLEGALWIDRSLAGIVRNAESPVALASWPVEALAGQVKRSLSLGRPVRITIAGESGSGATHLAAASAARASLPPMIVDTTGIADTDWTDRYVRLQRLAAISGAALVWTGEHVGRAWPALVAPAPVHFCIVDGDAALRPLPHAFNVRIDMPPPTIDERRMLWRSVVPSAAQWPDGELDALALHYRLGAGDILAIAEEAPPSAAAAGVAARTRHQTKGGDVVSTIACPYGWHDLVLHEPLKSGLSEFAFEAVEREKLWESPMARRLFPREVGLVALFSGPPGTGKTMAAQVIAADLCLDLLRVDLASVMSKYIGETAKNLNKVFAAARQRQAVLLFDEADAHFARRTEVKDAHDRYANADTSHLLQLIEGHRGIVILATNRRSDMDPAFIRRLRHVFEFPLPAPAERLQLWQRAIAAAAPAQWPALTRGVGQLADGMELSGAQIKNALLTALFAARRERVVLGFPHLLRGIDREFAKEGRPLSPKDRERWLCHG